MCTGDGGWNGAHRAHSWKYFHDTLLSLDPAGPAARAAGPDRPMETLHPYLYRPKSDRMDVGDWFACANIAVAD